MLHQPSLEHPTQQQPQHPQQIQPYRYPEEQVDFDYGPYSQHTQYSQTTAPDGIGPNHCTPEKKRKPNRSNATTEYYHHPDHANEGPAEPCNTNENSVSESADGEL
jgi:hypothetical protein